MKPNVKVLKYFLFPMIECLLNPQHRRPRCVDTYRLLFFAHKKKRPKPLCYCLISYAQFLPLFFLKIEDSLSRPPGLKTEMNIIQSISLKHLSSSPKSGSVDILKSGPSALVAISCICKKLNHSGSKPWVASSASLSESTSIAICWPVPIWPPLF